jgi:competence ComEA-like helix-hairpin-helix protein
VLRPILKVAVLAAAIALSVGAYQNAVEGAEDLPEGPGKTLVVQKCAKCHGIDQFSWARHSKEEWDVLIDKMTEEGLELSEDDYQTAVGYLSKFLSRDAPPAKIKVNRLGAAVLEERLGITDKEAEAIVKHREQNGPFKSWQDVAKVPGVDAKKIEAAKDLIQI